MDYTNNIKAMLVKNGIKHSEMAEKLGITATTFSHKINRKGRKNFNIDEAILMCRILKVTLNEIFLIDEVA